MLSLTSTVICQNIITHLKKWYDIDSCHCWARPIFQKCPIVVWLPSGVFQTGNTLMSIETVLINDNLTNVCWWHVHFSTMFICQLFVFLFISSLPYFHLNAISLFRWCCNICKIILYMNIPKLLSTGYTTNYIYIWWHDTRC